MKKPSTTYWIKSGYGQWLLKTANAKEIDKYRWEFLFLALKVTLYVTNLGVFNSTVSYVSKI